MPRHKPSPSITLAEAMTLMEQSQLPLEERPLRPDEIESHLLLLRAVLGQLLIWAVQTNNSLPPISPQEGESDGSEHLYETFYRVRAVTSTERSILRRLLTSHGPNYCPTIGELLSAGLAEVSTQLHRPTSERQ